MGKINIDEEIDKLIENHFDEENEFYRSYTDDSNKSLKEEIKELLDKEGITHKILEEEGFDSPGYSENALAVSFIDNDGKLKMKLVMLSFY